LIRRAKFGILTKSGIFLFVSTDLVAAEEHRAAGHVIFGLAGEKKTLLGARASHHHCY
jgi:hypothetical protein